MSFIATVYDIRQLVPTAVVSRSISDSEGYDLTLAWSLVDHCVAWLFLFPSFLMPLKWGLLVTPSVLQAGSWAPLITQSPHHRASIVAAWRLQEAWHQMKWDNHKTKPACYAREITYIRRPYRNFSLTCWCIAELLHGTVGANGGPPRSLQRDYVCKAKTPVEASQFMVSWYIF